MISVFRILPLVILVIFVVACAHRTNSHGLSILDALGRQDVGRVIDVDDQIYGAERYLSVFHSPNDVSEGLCATKQLDLELALVDGVWEEVGESSGYVLSLDPCQELAQDPVFVSVDGPEEPDWDRIGQAISIVEEIILGRTPEAVAYSSEEVRLSIRSLKMVDMVGISQMKDGVVVRLLGEKLAPQLATFRLALAEGVVQSVSIDNNDAIEVVPDP